MLALVAIVLGVGFADSINPSTVGPALYFAAGRDAGGSLLGFIAGVFSAGTVAGLAFLLGPARALRATRPQPHTEHLIEIGAAALLIVLAAGLWLGRRRVARHIVTDERAARRSPAFIGAAIMAVELPTALPYFAVIAAVTASKQTTLAQVALIVLFNLVFVAPLIVVLVLRQTAPARSLSLLAVARERLDRHAAVVAPALVLLIALVLLTVGTVGLTGSHARR